MLMTILNLITIKTPAQLSSLSIQTYILGAILGVVLLLIAAIIATMIDYIGGSSDEDSKKRRFWFWVLFSLSFIGFFLYNMFIVSKTIAPNLESKFMITNIIGSIIATVVYLILGIILSKIFSKGKLGSWFPSKKNN